MKKTDKNQELFDQIVAIAREDKQLDRAIPVMLKLREDAKAVQDPLATKILRLSAEFIEKYDHFDIGEHLEEEVPEGMTALEYLTELLADSDNKFNREEISNYKEILLQA